MTAPDATDGPSANAASATQGIVRRRGAHVAPALAALVTFCASGGAAFFMLPGGGASISAPRPTERASESEAAAKPHSGASEADPSNSKATKKREKKPHAAKQDLSPPEGRSEFVIRGDVGVFIPRPIVVTLKPQGRIRYLKVGIAIETSTDADDAFFEREFRIIDMLNAYLRSVPIHAIEDPAAMARIREQIARRVKFAVDEAPVDAVLITDFILS